MTTAPRVGVLALQGGVREHLLMLESVGAQSIPVRNAGQLADLDGLILPGGESSTMDRLLRTFHLRTPIARAIQAGLPTLATCAGLVLLASWIVDPAPGQQTLGILDMTVQRNAFGSQAYSEEATVQVGGAMVRGAFIRAPIVTHTGPRVHPIGTHRGQVVAVRSGSVTGIAFHPELTGDATLHQQLMDRAARYRARRELTASAGTMPDQR